MIAVNRRRAKGKKLGNVWREKTFENKKVGGGSQRFSFEEWPLSLWLQGGTALTGWYPNKEKGEPR
ncbi:hypothetical protein GMLC_25120 [Geomonas limicola]|uniref:Uncharacterized protein n=1 Tax=Geomonas limicola TaxID=2740186 RepID=A0A6V8NBL5_9BACT|nr:hypothetical protein GMLC_25120 [Geomonas limicola]